MLQYLSELFRCLMMFINFLAATPGIAARRGAAGLRELQQIALLNISNELCIFIVLEE